MLEPHIFTLTTEEYEESLRSRWHQFNRALSPKHWESASKCLVRQSEYARRQLFVPLVFLWQDKRHLFLQIDGTKFTSDDEKIQFIKEVQYLFKIDSKISGHDGLNLNSFLNDMNYQPENPNVLPFIQIFINKKQD